MIPLDEKKSENTIPLTSPEFLFLLERIDRVEVTLRQEIKQEIAGLKQENAGSKGELKNEIAEVKGEIAGLRSLIWATMGLILGTLALTATVAVAVLR